MEAISEIELVIKDCKKSFITLDGPFYFKKQKPQL